MSYYADHIDNSKNSDSSNNSDSFIRVIYQLPNSESMDVYNIIGAVPVSNRSTITINFGITDFPIEQQKIIIDELKNAINTKL
tara:strand:- start:99 stop:347 length:249 start_codon:yes stop_codon:yes gene_type:complete